MNLAGLKNIIALCTALLLPSIVLAETVGRADASRVASMFFNIAFDKEESTLKPVYDGRQLTTSRLFPPFYVFNHADNGFVIVSAENKAFPILGYSLEGKFNPGVIGPGLARKLRGLAREIEELRHDSRVPERAVSAWGDMKAYISGILTSAAGNGFRRLPEEREMWLIRDRASEFESFNIESEGMKNLLDADVAKTEGMKPPLVPEAPDVVSMGGGHFRITVPENILLVRVYNLQGGLVDRCTFKNTNSGVINLDGLPNGFYMAVVTIGSGKSYGIKLYK